MKIVSIVARILLGLIFTFFGLNLLIQFLPNPPIPPGPVRDFMTVMAGTHYLYVVGFFQAAGGLMLLFNRWVPLALTVLAAEIVNILATHFLVIHGQYPMPIFTALVWLFVFWRHRSAFAGIFQARTAD
jgi:putative oxidoreductase